MEVKYSVVTPELDLVFAVVTTAGVEVEGSDVTPAVDIVFAVETAP